MLCNSKMTFFTDFLHCKKLSSNKTELMEKIFSISAFLPSARQHRARIKVVNLFCF